MSFSRSSPGLLALSLAVLPLGAAEGCAGSEFSAAETGEDARAERQAGAGGGGAGGTAGKGGASGSSGKGGSAAGGTAGGPDASAGAPGCAQVSCPNGQYCNSDSAQCQACGDVSRFRFGAPEKLDAVSNIAATNQRFPRVNENATEMFFRTGSGASLLWVTPDFNTAGAQQAFGPGVNVPNQGASGPLEAEWRPPTGGALDFFFDRTVSGPDSRRTLMAALRGGGINVGLPVLMPPPFNTDNTTPSSNYSIAIAATSQRAWWMTTRAGPAQLVTAPLAPGSQQVPIDIPLDSGPGCKRQGPDATPWSPPNGAFLLFAALEHDASCAVAGSARDLYVIVVNSNGQPALPAAFNLQDLNAASSDDTDPSMSPDLCWLYFASNEGDTEYDVFRAPRR